ncbi:response regulator [Maribacter ulvicola]|jgi:response regulator RpfG family c-di-GMP phosphodiesterase|uniref:Response regulator receiver domain-containing protein n=1 Tax=Maribacter ulvicola TaxID=228959 RepID=A0A1N6QC25_9FLAO|nr:response regulator [Maribacter ulvicola]SIQ14129.1 Response regulator receiver domain-containing protein [Maribacter ulvicola]
MKEKVIWVLDDDMVSQFAILYSIEQSFGNCRVVSFYNPLEVLEHLLEYQSNNIRLPDKLLVDIVMPEMSGWLFLNELKKVPELFDKIDIYIISTFSNPEDRNLVKTHTLIKEYFNKPVSKNSITRIFS